MTALVGQFTPGGHWCSTRHVDFKPEPTWMLLQMRRIWLRNYGRATSSMVIALLAYDWSVLAARPRARGAKVDDPWQSHYVADVGWAYLWSARRDPQFGKVPADPPINGRRWAYLWEDDCAALHVYVAARTRWHHIATLPIKVFAGLTLQLTCDIEERRSWVEERR